MNEFEASFVKAIEAEFSGPVPTVPDNYHEGSEAREETEDFWSKTWGELSVADFDERRSVFHFLPNECIPYYLGAMMNASIRERNVLIEANETIVRGTSSNPKKQQGTTFSNVKLLLSDRQRDLYADYLELARGPQDAYTQEFFDMAINDLRNRS